MRLNDSQIQAFNENGYHLYGPLLSVEEADRMARVSLACVENSHSEHASQRVNKMSHSAGGDGIAAAFYQLRCAHLMHPGFESIVRDEGLLDAVESLLGPNLRLIICQGMYKPPHHGDKINWHQDDYYFRVDKPNAVVSCWLTFDDATVDNGCMWVIPGAHKRMVEHRDVPSGNGFYIPDVDESKAIPLAMPRGHCMLHHGLMPHRTLANTTSSHRRALAIHYMDATARPSKSRQQEPPENMPVVRGQGLSW